MTIEYTKLKENRIVLRNAIPLDKPFTLLIEPSSLCNFRCKMCFQSVEEQGEFAQKKGNMSMDCFREVIGQAKNWRGDRFKVLKLCIFGEPLMNANFSEMLSLAKKADIAERIETTTNASLLNENICEQMVKNELDYLRVSIYGANQKKHYEVTGSKIDLIAIHNNLKKLQEVKLKFNSDYPFIAIKMLDTFSENENQAFKEYFSDVADEIYIDAPHNWVEPNNEGFMDKLYEGKLKDLRDNGQFACPMPFTTLAVRSNGDTAPCCIDWFGGTIIGNIFSETLEEMWKGKKLYYLQSLQLTNKKEKNASCSTCGVFANPHYTKDNIDGVSVKQLER